MAVDQDMERFLRMHLSQPRDNPLVKIALRHAAPSKQGHDVESFAIQEGMTIDSLKIMADEILCRAQADSDGLGGVQRYVIQIYPKDDLKSVARFAFRLRGQEDEYDDSMGGEESASSRGLLAQLMRHNEANSRTLNLASQGMMTSMVRRIESQDRLIEHLISQRQKDLEILEDAKSQQHDRDMDALMTANAEERKDKLLGKVALMIPIMLNHVTGKKILSADDPNVIMLKSFAESLDQDQMIKIQSSLSTEQKIAFFQILQQLQPKLPSPTGGNGS